MEIDFRLRSAGSGLVMQLLPGLPDDAAALGKQVFIAEAAFGFIEPCIRRCWPVYAGYAHWGTTVIPVEAWLGVVCEMNALREALLRAQGPEQVQGLGFILGDIRIAFARDFTRMRGQIADFIGALTAWLEGRCAQCSHITVIGI